MPAPIEVVIPCGLTQDHLDLMRLQQQVSDANTAAQRLDTDEADHVVLFAVEQYRRVERRVVWAENYEEF